MSEAHDQRLIGFTIAGKYAIRRVIGVGGFGAVYEGVHTEIGKRVAIKVIAGALAESPEVAGRFRREARAASAVESEHIVQVFDVGQDPVAGLFMVMEHLQGEDLAQRLERERRIPVDQATVIASQIARALIRAHDAGVIHRDLKPGNIFLCERADGSVLVKVLDFGISKMLNEEQEAKHDPQAGKLTRVGSVVGTPQYMSPEQAQGLATVDHRTDLWSLGAIFYEMLAGQPAYDLLSSYEQTIVHIVVNPAPPLHVRAPWVPHTLSQIVHGCLDHNLQTRIRDAATFLRRVREVSGVAIRDYSGMLPVAEASSPLLATGVIAAQTPCGGVPSVAPSALPSPAPGAANAGPSTLDFDMGSQPNIPLAAFGVQASPRPMPATSQAPVSLEGPRRDAAPSLTDAEAEYDAPAHEPANKRPIALVLSSLLVAGALVTGLAWKQSASEGTRAPRPAAALPARPALEEPTGTEEPPPAETATPATPADAGKRREPKTTSPSLAPAAYGAPPTRAPTWTPPPPKAAKDRKLGDVGHTDEF
jgi:serine/threonine protein kinase